MQKVRLLSVVFFQKDMFEQNQSKVIFIFLVILLSVSIWNKNFRALNFIVFNQIIGRHNNKG